MTIRRGEPWGERRSLPDGIPSVGSDADAGRWFDDALPGAALRGIVLCSGDLARTLGSVAPPDVGQSATMAVVDVLSVSDAAGGQRTAVAHVVITAGTRGSRWWRHRGRLVAVMNAQFIGDADPTPRAHPADGRADLLDLAREAGLRARRQIRRRLRSGSHLPHPLLGVSSAAHHVIDFDGPCTVFVDGEAWLRRPSGLHLSVDVVPDALAVWC